MLVNSGCSSTIVSQKVCQTWQKHSIDGISISDRMQLCGISFLLRNERVVVIEVLVMLEDLLGFILLMKIDTIKALGRVSISKLACEPVSKYLVAQALFIKELNFQVEFDQQQNKWMALWK